MLKKLRHKKTAKKIWIGLAIIILPAFVLWGTGSVMRNKETSAYAGIIFGKKITLLDYRDSYSAVTNLAIMRFGDSLPEIKKSLALESQAWERLILLAETQKRKISASDKEVIETLQNYPVFMRQGRFDQRIYTELLQYVFHVQARAFEEQTRQNIILRKLYDELTAGVKISDKETREEYEKFNEEISLYYLAALAADFAKDIALGEDEVKGYFAKNALSFKQPLSFNVEYAALPAAAENENQIKEEIKKIFLRLNNKEDFALVAKDFKLELKESGLFSETDPIPAIGWAPQLMSAISKAKTGDYLPPAYLDKNFYILKIKEIKAPFIPELSAIKDKVKDAMVKDKSREIAKAKIKVAIDKLVLDPNQAGFEKIAKEEGLKSGSTTGFKYGSYIEGIGASDIFWMKAKELKEGQVSSPIDTPEGFYVIKLKSKTAIDEKKFSEDKDDFAKKLLLLKKSEYFARFTQELKRKTQAFF